MKKIITLIVLFVSLTTFANTVIVKGYVKDSSGKAVANQNIRITTDTLLSNCNIVHYKITNPNGYYIDTITCNGDIKKLRIYTESCNGKILVNDPLVTPNKIIESNFIICKKMPPALPPVIPIFCGAYFKFSAQGTSVKFSSSSNLLAPNDTVIGYKWDFGDNTSNLTSKDPLYVYVKAGTYVVCLTIKTARGCESKICETITLRDSVPPVVVLPPLINCIANFAFIPQLSGVKFNSNMIIVAPHDTIVSRKWDFGDGETKINTIDPVHIYTKLGKYNVCFSIKTAKGCESRICKTVVLGDSLSTVIGSILEPIKIIKVYPNPVHDKLNILAWSLNKDVAAEISVVDVYGQKKFSKKVTLAQGNSSIDINTSMLANEPYFLKITTVFGVVSIRFYKF